MIGPEVSAIVYAYIVARGVREEEALAPVAPIATLMDEIRTFAHPWVIPDPEEENDLQPEHPIGVVERFGVVDGPEPVRLTPQALVHEHCHERVQTGGIPAITMHAT